MNLNVFVTSIISNRRLVRVRLYTRMYIPLAPAYGRIHTDHAQSLKRRSDIHRDHIRFRNRRI